MLGAHGSHECAGFKVHEGGRLRELPQTGSSAVRQAPAPLLTSSTTAGKPSMH